MANEYLRRTPTSTGNRRVWTFSAWIKINNVPSLARLIFAAGSDSSNRSIVYLISPTGSIDFYQSSGGVAKEQVTQNDYHRDYSSWMHILAYNDTTKTNSTDGIKIFVNGYQSSNDVISTYTKNFETWVNSTNTHSIGEQFAASAYPFLGEMFDVFLVDGQALTPDVFGFYKQGKGYISAGSTQATDFRPGQWVPKTPRVIKTEINRRGGFGVNGFYLPMNDSSNFGADFHCTPNSIIKLKGEDLPQPRNGAPTTTDTYVSQLRTDPYAANLVLAVPGISTYRGPELVSEGTFNTGSTGSWTSSRSATLTVVDNRLRVTNTSSSTSGAHLPITCEVGKVYNFSFEIFTGAFDGYVGVTDSNTYLTGTFVYGYQQLSNGFYSVTFRATSTTQYIHLHVYGGSTGNYKDFDNISVREVNEPIDYSANIKGSGTNKTLTGNGGAGIAAIPSYYGSALSFDGAGDYFDLGTNADFNFGSGDFTIEFWRNKSRSATESYVARLDSPGGSATSDFWFGNVSGVEGFYWYEGSTGRNVSSPSISTGQWDHLAAVRYGNNITLYVNGVAVGINTTVTYSFNSGTTDFRIGGDNANSGNVNYPYQGSIQDLRIYKGVAKYKGGFDVPRPYTPVGIATWRQVPDTTANNFATMNPLIEARPSSGTDSPSNSTLVTFAGGNLDLTNSASSGNAQRMVSFATIGISTGRWYWEVRAGTNDRVGISKGFQQKNYGGQLGGGSGLEATVTYESNGVVSFANTAFGSATTLTPPSYDTTNIIGVAVSANNGLNNLTIQFFKDGVGVTTLTGVGATSPVLEWFPSKMMQGSASGSDQKFNFGQNPTFSGNTTAGTFTDANGKGLFKYQPPSGFLALCEDNLPTPAISDPGKHFKTVLYTGDGASGRSIVGVGFTPDLVWYKARSSAFGNGLFDSVRGTFRLSSDGTGAENTDQGVISFNSDGFSLGNHASGNTSGTTMVAWCWRAGAGTTTANTDGSIPSVVSVNQDAGFSIVSYRGTGANATVGHGLGKKPAFMVFKQRNQSDGWIIYHQSITATKFLQWDTDPAASLSTFLNNTEPTSSVFSLGSLSNANDNGWPIISYCWAEIEGFSKFGSYVGNGNADGPFIWTGFLPAWVMIKRTDGAADWVIHDSSRTSTNPSDTVLRPNTSDVDLTASSLNIDFLSNGFKIRNTNGSYNNAETYIFAAFAQSPFSYSNAK